MWFPHHEEAWNNLKLMITKAPLLKYYNVEEEVTIQCDASEYGLGATLLQNGQPVCFASQALTRTERAYAQIEKECLAIVFSCERFEQYIFGRTKITVQTDHKPLLPILKKPIHSAPKRLQRMLLRLQKYELELVHVPGKQMLIADFLSRSCLDLRRKQSTIMNEIEHVNQIDYVNVSETTKKKLQDASKVDENLTQVMRVVQNGWPEEKAQVPPAAAPYFTFRDEITVQDGIVYKGQQVIVPKMLQSEMLKKVHSSHQGIEACSHRARESLFWIGMTSQIKDHISGCDICNSMKPKQQKETLMTWPIPTERWQMVGQDIFTINRNRNYLITVDYFPDYWEVEELENISSQAIIKHTKQHFARHGIPNIVISDNRRQFVSQEYEEFAKKVELPTQDEFTFAQPKQW